MIGDPRDPQDLQAIFQEMDHLDLGRVFILPDSQIEMLDQLSQEQNILMRDRVIIDQDHDHLSLHSRLPLIDGLDLADQCKGPQMVHHMGLPHMT